MIRDRVRGWTGDRAISATKIKRGTKPGRPLADPGVEQEVAARFKAMPEERKRQLALIHQLQVERVRLRQLKVKNRVRHQEAGRRYRALLRLAARWAVEEERRGRRGGG